MSKRVQVEMSTFLDVYRLLFALEDYELDYDTQEIVSRLETALNAKLDAMLKHDTYTMSKVAPTEVEREAARQNYLDMVGMKKDWRYSKDIQKNIND
ncbi:complexin-2 [Tyzzerella sp. OttesenSCG-928-J15]|nr:complexin-2 [Tyzzerella sp. OttesenSCG-928-J15]